MRKNLCHIFCFLILVIISLNHYQFAKNDRRNFFDLHEQLYNTSVLDCYDQLNKISIVDQDQPFYAKVFGAILYFFGKDYFVLRVSYLLFFLLYLIAFYLLICFMKGSAFVALLSLVINISIPGIVSYSRMCWPHMQSASFILWALVFLFLFMNNNKKKYIWFCFLIIAFYVSVKIYCTSLLYIFLILLWLLFLYYKKIFVKQNLIFFSFLLLPLFALAMLLLYDDVLMLLDKGMGESYLSVFDFYEYYLLFLNKIHFIIFSVFVMFGLVNFCFRMKQDHKKNVILLFVFLLFSLVASFFQYPIHVTVLGVSSGCVFVSCFICGLKNKIVKNCLLWGIIIFTLIFNIRPEIFILPYDAAVRFYKTAIIADTRSWGREELQKWLADKNVNSLNIALLGESFYPNNGTNYITLLDISMLEEIYKNTLTVFNSINLYGVDSMQYMYMLEQERHAEIEFSNNALSEALFENKIDYLIFDEILESFYWLFPNNASIVFYKLVKQEIANKSLGGNGFLREVKRIKCPVKDIVIYSIEK